MSSSTQNSHIHYLDVQPFLRDVCDGMAVGELLCGDHFSLHDAMVAIEIGDPKMDVGLRRGDTRSAEELISEGLAPIDISPEVILSVVDRIFQMETTWHAGIMLSQTVFTSLYLLDTSRLERSPVLHAAALGVRSACTLFHDAAMSGQVVDGEDMMLHVFGFKLDLPGVKPVKNAQEALQKGIQAAEQLDSATGKALASRLHFRVLLLEILQEMTLATEESVAKVPTLCTAACTLLNNFLSSALTEDTLAAAPGFAPEVHRKAMGLAPPRPVDVPPFATVVEDWKTMLHAIGDAAAWLLKCSTWGDLKRHLINFAATPKNLPLVRSLVHRAIVGPLKKTPATFAKSSSGGAVSGGSPSDDIALANLAAPAVALPPSPQASPLARPPRWVPSEAMIAAEFSWPAESPPGPDACMFLEQCSIAAQGWCHTHCLNRCRQHRRLRRLLEDWRNILDHGFNAEVSPEAQVWFMDHGWKWQPTDPDGAPIAGPVTAWVESQVAETMTEYLMFGQHLEIYAPHEFCAVYWYCDYLLGSMHGAYAELDNMKPVPASPSGGSGTGKKGGKGGKSKVVRKAPIAAAAGTPSEREERLVATTLAAKVDRLMCQAIMRLSLGLTWLGVVKPPQAPFNSERERFHQRFSSFEQIIRPQSLSYDEYKRSTDPGKDEISAPRVLLAAYEAFGGAQGTIATLENSSAARLLSPEQLKHFAGVKRIATQNMMAVKLLINSITGPTAVEVLPFCVGWDFKTALQSSTWLFYPALVLKSAAAGAASSKSGPKK